MTEELRELKEQYREYMRLLSREFRSPDSIMLANIESIKQRIKELEK